jgi:hypothetical protein
MLQPSTQTPTSAMNINLRYTNFQSRQFNREAVDTLKEIIKQRNRLIKMGTSKVNLYRSNKRAIKIFEYWQWTDPAKTANFILRHEVDFREIIPGKNQKLKARFNAVITLANQFKPVNNEN